MSALFDEVNQMREFMANLKRGKIFSEMANDDAKQIGAGSGFKEVSPERRSRLDALKRERIDLAGSRFDDHGLGSAFQPHLNMFGSHVFASVNSTNEPGVARRSQDVGSGLKAADLKHPAGSPGVMLNVPSATQLEENPMQSVDGKPAGAAAGNDDLQDILTTEK